jgi:hypothetical protein
MLARREAMLEPDEVSVMLRESLGSYSLSPPISDLLSGVDAGSLILRQSSTIARRHGSLAPAWMPLSRLRRLYLAKIYGLLRNPDPSRKETPKREQGIANKVEVTCFGEDADETMTLR